MTLYARNRVLRFRQIVGDTLLAFGIGFFVWLGNLVDRLVHRLEAPGRLLQGAGDDLAGVASGAGSKVDDLPFVGDRLRAPFDVVAAGGRTVRSAGLTQQRVVADLAL